MGHDYYVGYRTAEPPHGWYPGSSAGLYPTPQYSPFAPWSLAQGPPGTKAGYGSEGDGAVAVLGLGCALSGGGSDSAFSFVHHPNAYPYLAGLSVCGKGPGKCPPAAWPVVGDGAADAALYFGWDAEGYRLGQETTPVVLDQNLLITNRDWRPVPAYSYP